MFPIRAKRRLIAASALTASVALVLTACTDDLGSEGNGEEGDQRIAGYSMPYLTNQFMVSMNEEVITALEEAGYDVRPTTDAGSQSDQQVQDVQNLIASGVTGLGITPYDSGAIVAALNAAEAADVPVVLIDVGATGGTAYMTVRADNVGAAATVCDEMGARLEERYGEARGTVLQLQGELSSVAGQDRTNGFVDCMEEKFPDVEILSQPTEWDGAVAADATQTIVNSRDIDGIYMHSDCGMLAPVQSVLTQAGESTMVDDPDRIILGAIDGCPATLESIRAGEMDFTVEQPLNAYGRSLPYFLDAAMSGETFAAGDEGFEGSEIVENEHGQLENLLPATLVTQDNVDDPMLWGNGE